MSKHLLAATTAVVMMTGIASAQTYPRPTTPPEVPAPGTSSSTTISPGPDSGYHATTTQHGVDMYGNPVTRKDTYREGAAGSSETHTTTTTDPWAGGTTTTHTTTTNQR
jgi:hypothetical protein